MGAAPEREVATVRRLAAEDREWAERVLAEAWASARIVCRGRLHDATQLPGLVAWSGGERIGLLTYQVQGDECEVVTLNALRSGAGIGTALLNAARDVALQAGCRRMVLITTNDNTPALRFYQRRGWRLSALRPNAMEAARLLKPEIPPTGVDGIPIRDELELMLDL